MFNVLKQAFPDFKSLANRSRNIKFIANMPSEKLNSLENVKIDENGDYKYILVRVSDETCNPVEHKYIVRGTGTADYHDDIYQDLKKVTKASNLRTETLGGGRISFNANKNSIRIYDRSVAFGRADHEVTKHMLEDYYKDYHITFVPE